MSLGEVMKVKGVKGVKTYVLQLNNYAKKTIVPKIRKQSQWQSQLQ